jgi:hypothetical protein
LELTGIGELTVQNKPIDVFSNLSSPGGKAFLELLLPRLNPRNINGGPAMPFQLEVMDMLLLYSSVFSQKSCIRLNLQSVEGLNIVSRFPVNMFSPYLYPWKLGKFYFY